MIFIIQVSDHAAAIAKREGRETDIYRMFNKMLLTSVGVGEYGFTNFPCEGVFKQMLQLSSVKVKVGINSVSTPADTIWKDIAQIRIDRRFGRMSPKSDAPQGLIGWLGFGGPTEKEMATEKIAEIKIEVRNEQKDTDKFPLAILDRLDELKPEPALWAICKHFPWWGSSQLRMIESGRENSRLVDSSAASRYFTTDVPDDWQDTPGVIEMYRHEIFGGLILHKLRFNELNAGIVLSDHETEKKKYFDWFLAVEEVDRSQHLEAAPPDVLNMLGNLPVHQTK